MQLFFCLPLLGRLLKWVWNLLLTLLGLPSLALELIFLLLGVRPQKKMRLAVLVLMQPDGSATAQVGAVLDGIRRAIDIFEQQANVQLIPLVQRRLSKGTLQLGSGLYQRSAASPPQALDVHCNLAAAGEDLWKTGSRLDYYIARQLFDSNFRRLFGLGAPLTAVVVREIYDFGGCSLGPLTDYVTLKPRTLLCLAHELGHACNLVHTDDQDNLMYTHSCRPETLTPLQVALLRASRHVSFF